MGTRADFYIGRGKDAEWIGSIAFDGYPDGDPLPCLDAKTARQFRNAVKKILAANERHCSRPDDGWPWPRETSATTDFAYAFDGKVYASCFGSSWVSSKTQILKGNFPESKLAEFPTMERPKVIDAGRNGILLLSMFKGASK